MNIRIYPPEEILETTVKLPLSKSESARALIMNALVGDGLQLGKVADCDDTNALIKGLSTTHGDVNIGAAGTAMRFLTAYYAATPGCDVTLDGSERMRQRPIAPLVNALRQLGADIQYIENEGFAPLKIVGKQLVGGELTIRADVSSQFISAVLMVAPTMANPLQLTLDGEITSLPYLLMTIEMMRRRAINVDFDKAEGLITVQQGTYDPNVDDVTCDWSAASYWYAIAAVTAGWVTLPGLSERSLQGDKAIAQIGPKFGVITDFDDDEGTQLSATPDLYSRLDLDMSDTPDLVQTVVVIAGLLGLPFTISGVHTLKNKETDRIAALHNEMLKLGVVVEVESDNLISWDGRRLPIAEVPTIDTYDDHRMAMSFAVAAAYLPGILIRNAEVVSKSYPDFWRDLANAGFTITDADSQQNSDEDATDA